MTIDVLAEFKTLIAGMSAKELAELDDLLEPELSARWLPTPGPQTTAYVSPADLMLYGGAGGGGKGLDVNTPIPTPRGWTPMGALQVGDSVYDDAGHVCRVVGVSDVQNRKCFELTFDDGSVLVADDAHRWKTMTEVERMSALRRRENWKARRRASRSSRAAGNKSPAFTAAISARNSRLAMGAMPTSGEVRDTQEIAETAFLRRGAANHSIGVARPIQGADASLPLDAYTLGLWLGDGHTASGIIGMLESDWAEILPFVPYPVSSKHLASDGRKNTFADMRFKGVQSKLREMGLLGCKRIPVGYLRASVDQRIALLRGLLDTDGTCDLRGQIEIGLSNADLAADVHELVQSLGIKCTSRIKRLSEKNPAWADHYRMKFMAPFIAFNLPRKAARQKTQGFRPTVHRRFIVGVREVPSTPTRCIAVDSPSRLYLAGTSFIPTHNTDLIVGLAANDVHERIVIFRRSYSELSDIAERLLDVLGSRSGWNGSDMRYKRGDKLIEFGALEKPGSEKGWRGRAHDLICFDEGGELSKQKVSFVMGWNRSTKEGQRCRVVIASNPPSGSDGQWLIEWFAPWVDPLFPNPAVAGEIRWAYYDPKRDCTVWVDGPGTTQIEGEEEPVEHKSRTFIPALLDDNPYLRDTNYRSTLQQLPEPLRSQMLKGDFLAGREDHEWQVIPSEWIKLAQERWKAAPKKRRTMLSLAADVALAKDWTVLAPLYSECYFGELIKKPGAECSDPADIATMMLRERRDEADLSVDGTGGWGSGVRSQLKRAHGIESASIVFSAGSQARASDGKLGFLNLRAQMYWRFREALDPETGDEVCLPPDAKLAAQLAAHRYKIARKDQIQIEDKEEVKERVGSSPDEADSVVMAWHRRTASIKPRSTPPKAAPRPRGAQSWMGL